VHEGDVEFAGLPFELGQGGFERAAANPEFIVIFIIPAEEGAVQEEDGEAMAVDLDAFDRAAGGVIGRGADFSEIGLRYAQSFRAVGV
jgi:hypothetical protein